MASTRRLAVIMFTDLVGSTASAQRDEKAALRRQVEQEGLLRPLFARHEGREIKTTGDGFLVEFPSALSALECAVTVQQTLRDRNSKQGAVPLLVRIGLHLGDVEQRDRDLFGDTVNVAARIEPNAEPGGICLSEPVYVQVSNKVSYVLERIGPRSLKGVREPMELYKVVLPPATPDVPGGRDRPPRLAVLPFKNISPDPKDEYFADGLTEELITVLSQVKGLRVISRTSSSQYKGSPKPVVEIGAELGADSVLEGSVRKAGDQLRIVLQLIDTRTDEHRWAETYDRTFENIFAIQADVAAHAATALKVELLSGPARGGLPRRPTASLVAYEWYLRGIQALQQTARDRRNPELDIQVERCFEAALREDPRFGAAYARLAGYLIEQMGETRPASEVAPRARSLVAHALELDPDSADSYTARGYLRMQLDHDWAGAENDFLRALAVNPSSSKTHQYYGHLLGTLQRFDEAVREHSAALEQDPLELESRLAPAGIALERGDLESAQALAAGIVERYPEFFEARVILGVALALSGQSDAAARAVEPLGNLSGSTYRPVRALVLALSGRGQEARGVLAEWEAGRIPERVPASVIAMLYSAVGQGERALDLLERDAREGDNILWAMYLRAAFDPIREHPRFVALLRSLNLPTTLSRPLLFHPPAPPG